MPHTRIADLKDKRVVVVGLGLSGIAACRLLAGRGVCVVGADTKGADEVSPSAKALAVDGVELVLGDLAVARMSEADLIVISPGVASFRELDEAESRGVPIWGEVELAARAANEASDAEGRTRARLVAIGGTNGKSTVTSLVGAVLERAGFRTFVGGNLGEPLCAHANTAFDVLVVEVSSFQMERVDAFHPHVAVLLNVTPDHLDRYTTIDAYAHAKGNAFLLQTSTDLAVVPINDDTCMRQACRGGARVVTFGVGGDLEVTHEAVVDHAAGATYLRSECGLQGGHNALNVAAALAAIRPFHIDPAIVKDVLKIFRGLPHRMALVRELDGIRYFDDSKGTNVGASVTALRGLTEPKVVLIAGGRDKGGSYAPLAEALREKGRAIVLIGEASALLAAAVGAAVPVFCAATMADAVRLASEAATAGDAVLLSPACSSFDMFRDYKHRGDAFVDAVQQLRKRSP